MMYLSMYYEEEEEDKTSENWSFDHRGPHVGNGGGRSLESEESGVQENASTRPVIELADVWVPETVALLIFQC